MRLDQRLALRRVGAVGGGALVPELLQQRQAAGKQGSKCLFEPAAHESQRGQRRRRQRQPPPLQRPCSPSMDTSTLVSGQAQQIFFLGLTGSGSVDCLLDAGAEAIAGHQCLQ